EDNEAAFFGSPDELVAKVRSYLVRDEARARIAAAGYRKITQGQHTYADRLAEIIEAARTVRGSQDRLNSGVARTSEIESNG
ncbi:glycosyltransferase family protein, partial [Candidatus Binatus sp.]